ncbi:Diacylglycerol acyltransferase/mycolyltransferase Ag85A precursor [Corynebacterium choanae]|uniref:Diacylglycerol acyltransferase/mycolyltransferase Ag85A n=1 Tax=Corynebacterium choanae TaxID=1862358 RepID=A0A3G6J8S9_9CORY|nr:alpha/beta hydrolase family protein [Corynebacterium choanae]AZA14525.1 Diacylglycerol acyltransferase/mycolyltransferase Ag85A precursor [Corynebacterium choanae]
MRLFSRIAVPVGATMLALGCVTVPAAQAGTPAAVVAGDTKLATVTDAIDLAGTGRPVSSTPGWVRDNLGRKTDPRLQERWAYSPSMDRQIPLFVMAPKDNSVPRPIIYVLNGGDGGEGRANWLYQTDIIEFYRNKNVWIVMPMAGAFSYYSDWVNESPALGGKQNWETFMTKELPGAMEAKLGASDKRGIIGMSMTGTTTLLYAEHQPGFYDAVGSFSGCAETSRGLPLEYLRITVNRGQGNPTQMWGPVDGETFRYNDALLNAARLKSDTQVYVSSGTGLAGPYDLWNTKFTEADSGSVFIHVFNGGIIEAATNKCAHDLKAKTDAIGATNIEYNLRPVGTHSWGYWQLDLRDSWPTFARAFNMDPGAPVPMNTTDVPAVTQEAITEIWQATLGGDPRLAQRDTLPLSPADGGEVAPLPQPAQPTAPQPAAPADDPAPQVDAPAPAAVETPATDESNEVVPAEPATAPTQPATATA